MLDKFIPVQVMEKGNKRIWYMDINNLSLSELIELRDELNGNYINSIAAIDSIIEKDIDFDYQELRSVKRKKLVEKEIRKPKRTDILRRRNKRR